MKFVNVHPISISLKVAGVLWVWFVGPWLARSCGIPVQTAFWKTDMQNQKLTRIQFILAFGVLIVGVGVFLFNLDSDIMERLFEDKQWSAKLFDLGFAFALSLLMGIVIGFVCAPTQIGESPVTKLDLFRH